MQKKKENRRAHLTQIQKKDKYPSDDQLMRKIEQLRGSEPMGTLEPAKMEPPVSSRPTIAITEGMRKAAFQAMGVQDENLARTLLCQVILTQMQAFTWLGGNAVSSVPERAIAAIGGIQPANATEAMLAVQMIGVHDAAVKFLAESTAPNQTFEGKDANVLRATRLMRLFNEQLEAMTRLKGKTGQQRVVVEHVNVNAGGQAIVGAVTAGNKGDQGEGGNEQSN